MLTLWMNRAPAPIAPREDRASMASNAPSPAMPTIHDEPALIAALKAGDEAAFLTLVEQYYPTMRRLAGMYLTDPAVVDDVVQEAWLGVVQSIGRFEGRSSLKTWLCRIVTNIAKTRSHRERRSIPFTALARDDDDSGEAAVEPERFIQAGRWVGHWATAPRDWNTVDDRLVAHETRAYIDSVLQTLPPSQRQVMVLRDIEGLNSYEVCNILGLSETNQRVLLHRARSKIRRALEQFFLAA